MALQTKTYTKSGSKSFTLTLTLTENSVNIGSNTSSITYKLVLKSGGYWFSKYSHGYSITLGGIIVDELDHDVYEEQISLDANSSLTIASGTCTIPHNNDGSLKMSVAYSFYTGYTGTISGTGTMALTQIDIEPEHTWDSGTVITAPTCDTDGAIRYTCSECGETRTEVIPKTGHTWNDGVVTTAATYDTDGVRTYTCSACGETRAEAILKTGGMETFLPTVRIGSSLDSYLVWVKTAAGWTLYRPRVKEGSNFVDCK